MSFLESIWDFIAFFFWAFILIAAIWALIAVITDLFRDKKLNGWWKAIWIIFLIFVPVLTTLVYIIARGSGMAERSAKEVQQAQQVTDDYIRSVASSGPADEIARAKELLDSGAISAEEFESLKQRALRH